MRKRCIFCHKPVDKTGHCQNKSCIDYVRTQIFEEAEAKRRAEAAAKEAQSKSDDKKSDDGAVEGEVVDKK